MKFTDIISCNRKLTHELAGSPTYRVSVLTNIVIHQLSPILEYKLRSRKINATVELCGYDNIVQNIGRVQDSDLVVLHWELANLSEGFHHKINLFDRHEIRSFLDLFKTNIDFVLDGLSKVPLVIMSKFSTLAFGGSSVRRTSFEAVCDELNRHIEERVYSASSIYSNGDSSGSKLANNVVSNIVFVDMDRIIANLTVDRAVSYREWYSSKALYTVAFLEAYSEYICPIVFSLNGLARKAIVFDCDNTLWGGIVGEEGVDGIILSDTDQRGRVYQEIQSLARGLSRQGVIIALCSKNNFQDVEAVFRLRCKEMCLSWDDIAIKKINWSDKASNIREISRELNIALDSILFVDDSEFEISLVKQALPDVDTFLVPRETHVYPVEFGRRLASFFIVSPSTEDQMRTMSFVAQEKREESRSNFTSVDEYMQSLGLTMTVHVDDSRITARMAQLTQKTNQFNFTTKRYSEPQIADLVASSSWITYAIAVSDCYGDFGITGEIFVRLEKDLAIIDTFLLSCRVLGRKLEHKFMWFVIADLAARGFEVIHASYAETSKNSQVADFLDNVGFELVEELVGDRKVRQRNYLLRVSAYKCDSPDYIKLKVLGSEAD